MTSTTEHQRLWIGESAFADMQALADHHFPREVGGMLLGYEGGNGEAVVTAIIGPGPEAQHRRFFFAPDAGYQQTQLEAHFRRTKGKETYLGDWHTHPKGQPRLSLLDRRTLTRIARTASSGTEHPIMAILAGRPMNWDIAVVRFLSCTRRWVFNNYEDTKLLVQVFDLGSRGPQGSVRNSVSFQ